MSLAEVGKEEKPTNGAESNDQFFVG